MVADFASRREQRERLQIAAFAIRLVLLSL
jgi:hypothetical protein